MPPISYGIRHGVTITARVRRTTAEELAAQPDFFPRMFAAASPTPIVIRRGRNPEGHRQRFKTIRTLGGRLTTHAEAQLQDLSQWVGHHAEVEGELSARIDGLMHQRHCVHVKSSGQARRCSGTSPAPSENGSVPVKNPSTQ